ncbi:protein-L-isoaspartate O-methyltransferase [bacterium (Candidatus Blackallbacteria) CG17_big_fil_post_rev_8_21_14_2_50_48_46]|uniref:Protein-L-isoaspartate O-methyltransferase n=1 Tax=bacterium (Candidatus Blackallbacteria) CG17_big_fil_post_rev_8_21_14_2_50_48_46 TaxID=2014261 RepID=A0A2M7G0J3_9BACT|nr:MAG: protein-L-isoaspartate O-methyltransferase [bacterium (Candidatus Blackallbacteria) CG18_big_fil_WC_8_21_14_2_50_49_26]PIW15156.1 MAG: protein-L-isoaspartate O-methyltransferase [bacterium (Candidatus Blackallbacteria) CG17_big_fil_post_rev_8_21_14_2_50_48_46]PIW50168.1 MAG: protein-L-isoaspartate O-methyltransferase [bacterium (Candidatus Blackallbacteria) CG13_big_fil_rev_8_21_14_2_50_49_14]
MQNWQTYRAELCSQLKRQGISEPVLRVCSHLPRHLFAPELNLEQAYADRAMPLGHGQTISQPSLVARMTELLELSGQERVLEIGTGSGYQTAFLAYLAREVFTLERISELSYQAAKLLLEQGLRNIHFKIGDGYLGWAEQAPFDRILLTAAPPQLPEALLGQLAEGGLLVGPVGPQYEVQKLLRVRRRAQKLEYESCGDVVFVPMLKGL